MSPRPELRLPEELLLLALKDDKGTPHSSGYDAGLGGALLAELLLEERVALETGKKKKLKDAPVRLVSDRPLADPFLDECLAQLRTSKKPRSVQGWVDRFRRLKRLKRRLATSLCRRGILRERESRFLFFRWTVYPVLDAGPELRVVERIRDAVSGEAPRLDVRTALLIALASETGLLKPALGKQVLKERKGRIRQISSGEAVEPPLRESVEALRAATKAAKDAAAAAAVVVTAGG